MIVEVLLQENRHATLLLFYIFLDQGSQLCNIATGNCNPKAKGSMQTTHFLSHCPYDEIPNVWLKVIYYCVFYPLRTPSQDQYTNSYSSIDENRNFFNGHLIFPFCIRCGALPSVCLDLQYLLMYHDYVWLHMFLPFLCQVSSLLEL